MNKSLLVAICTYNEISNLPSLYQALRQEFPSATILVVDDNSPDGTGEWCDQTAEDDSLFRVLHREEKSGLGSATIAAFRFAIDQEFELILTMDGDWSHSPTEAKSVVDAASNDPDCGLAIGSRYVPGGSIEGWPLTRHIMSSCINTYSRWMIGIRIRDCSGAFRCYRVTFLKQINFSEIKGMGYAYLEEILWWAKRLKIKITETPITFSNRVQGKSKINLREAFHAVWILFKIGVGRCLGRN